MKLYEWKETLWFAGTKPRTVALGDFDGLHLGHQAVIQSAAIDAKQKQTVFSVMTFHPHPRSILLKDLQYEVELTPPGQKEKGLAHLGVEEWLIIPFTKEFADISPDEFVKDYLLPLNVKTVVCGFDFRFGKQAQGNPEYMLELGERYGFDVIIVAPVLVDDQKISSTKIRESLLLGQVEDVNSLLGRPYSFYGEVAHGDKRGRQIGFPTANLRLIEPFVVPAYGVYVVRVFIEHQQINVYGVMNIGAKPTFFENGRSSIEIHLLDYEGDLYGQILDVQVLHRLRAEQKFSSIDQLVQQISQDVEQAKSFIGAKSF